MPMRQATPLKKAYLARVHQDLSRLRHHPSDGPMIMHFQYDHSNTLIYDTTGKLDLLIPNTVPMATDIARLLQHCAPNTIQELIDGYRLALDAGLIKANTKYDHNKLEG